MSEVKRNFSEQKMIEEAEQIMREVNDDPEVANVKAPAEMEKQLFQKIREYEATKENILSAEYVFKKKNRKRKYLVLAAAAILAMAFGVTGFGEVKNVFESFTRDTLGREQIQVNSSEDTKVSKDWSEDEMYEAIEDEYGFYPVKLDWLPEGVAFREGVMSEGTQFICLVYGADEEINISYQIQPNYRESSWGKDIEDELLEEEKFVRNDVEITIRRYRIDDSIERWLVGFVYNDTSYSLLIMNLDEGDVQQIVDGLYLF